MDLEDVLLSYKSPLIPNFGSPFPFSIPDYDNPFPVKGPGIENFIPNFWKWEQEGKNNSHLVAKFLARTVTLDSDNRQ